MAEEKQKNKRHLVKNVFLEIPYIALALIFIFDVIYAVVLFVGFVKAGGYRQHLSQNLGMEFLGNLDINNGIIYAFCFVFTLMGIVYAIKHKGAKRILMIIFLGIQVLLALTPVALYAMYYIVPETNGLHVFWDYYGMFAGVEDIMAIIYSPLAGISLIPLFIMFMIEKTYREFVASWFLAALIHVVAFPVLLVILSYVVSAVIFVLIIEFVTIGWGGCWLYWAIKYRCPACGKIDALEYDRSELIHRREIAVKAEGVIKDMKGNVRFTSEHPVPGVEIKTMETYKCCYCGHEEKKIKTEKKPYV